MSQFRISSCQPLRGLILAALMLGVSALRSPAAQSTPLSAGVNLAAMDKTVRAQDDFFDYANGRWLKTTPIPDDRSSVSIASQLYDRSIDQLHELIEAAAKDSAAPANSEARKIGDLYASFMDEAAVEAAGLGALKGELTQIDALKSPVELPALFAHLHRIGVDGPYGVSTLPDARDSTRVAARVDQAGLGMPDRDYYLKDDDAQLRAIRDQYLKAIEKLLTLAGQPNAGAQAQSILAFETRIAQAQWPRTDLRDPVKTYNKFALTQLDAATPGYSWHSYLADIGVTGKVDYLLMGEPSYFKSFGAMVSDEPLTVWKSYLRWHLIAAFAPYLTKAFVAADFDFFSTALRGTPTIRPRWKRGVTLVDGAVGEALGKLYVAKYFPPATKARMDRLVDNLMAAYRQDVSALDWMGPATKAQALDKLGKMRRKIGYPTRWRDYSGLLIRRDDLVGNVIRSNEWDFAYQLGKLGKPVDREEWEMTPQTINAYYRDDLNEIVFPAAFLQPPYFDPKADDAANYGAVGAVIGHEMSHGFDDQGSQFDADGNLRDWWTKEDHARFTTKTAALVAQYAAFEAIPGYHINGKLTLGENIADNSGLAVAYKAYRLSLKGQKAAVMDGFSGAQRFYLSFSQAWAGKVRDKQQIVYLKSDPHSPYAARGSLPLSNQDAFYQAFEVKSGDRMYLPPEQRVHLW